MSNSEFLSRPPQRSRSGRLIKSKQPVDETEDIEMNAPHKRAAIKRARNSVYRKWHSARVSAIRDLEARNAQLATRIAELESRSSHLSFELSKCSTSELVSAVKECYNIRKELQSRGWITHWDARCMTHAIWVHKVTLYPSRYPLSDRKLGIELPSYHPRVVSAKIKQLLFNARGYSPTDSRNCPRLTRPEKIRCNSALLLHCINSGSPPGIKRGSTVYMSEGKTRRKLVATVLSVDSANHNDAPYREYGDQWQSYMTNSNTALPALVFK